MIRGAHKAPERGRHMNMQALTAYNYTSSYGLSEESKNCIRRVMGDKEGQEMIDTWEANERAQAMTPSATCTITPTQVQGAFVPQPPARTMRLQGLSVDDLCYQYRNGAITGEELAQAGLKEIERLPGLRERCQEASAIFDTLRTDPDVGKIARLGLSVMGDADYPPGIPYDSLLDRSRRDSRPSTVLYPALMEGLKNCHKASEVELVDIAEKMFDSIPLGYNDERPMEKLYAGLRELITLAGLMGEVEVANQYAPGLPGHLSTPLRNLKTDAQSYNIAKIYCGSVTESFGEMRHFTKEYKECKNMVEAVSEEGPPRTITVDIDKDNNIVNIGGVKLQINPE
jgi:hypothetical protein